MTTLTVKSGLVSMEAIYTIVKEMKKKGLEQVYPNKVIKGNLMNEAIQEVVIDEEGNVFLQPVNSNEVMLPEYAQTV